MEIGLAVVASALGLLFVLGFLILFYCFPHKLLSCGIKARQYYAGMTIKYVGDESMVFCYGERNSPRPDKPSIVFVHGFSSGKEQWIVNFQGLPKDLHMIALDMPGHGASSVPAEGIKLDLDFAMETLTKFLDLVDLGDKKIHLAGSSLGGAISGLFAATYPERIEKLTLVCPAMLSPVDSDFFIELKKAIDIGMENVTPEHCMLLPRDLQSLKKMLEKCCYNQDIVNFSDQISKGLLHLRLPKTDYFFRLYKDITSYENLDILVRSAPKITAPTQLIWGKQDQLVHISGAEELKSHLPNCRRVDIIDNCGHAIDIDRPGAFNKYLLKFINNEFEDFVVQNGEKKQVQNGDNIQVGNGDKKHD